MGIKREKWTRIRGKVSIETTRTTHKANTIFVSPGGFFIPEDFSLEPYSQVTVSFKVEDRKVVAAAEVRRTLTEQEAGDRGILHDSGGVEFQIVRMEGDGSQILADHIKKVLLESGGPS